MRIKGKHYRTIWYKDGIIYTINQPKLPHVFEIVEIRNEEEVFNAIKDMTIRGAPAIGAMAAFGMAQAIRNGKDADKISEYLKSARPTAYDLTHGVDYILESIKGKNEAEISEKKALEYADNSAAACKKIGEFGEKLIKDNITVLTHCNAGALATVDHGTALAPMRAAHDNGKNFHVFVDETRPRYQGARLTAFELAEEGIDYDIIPDNSAAQFMRRKKIQLVITGADRIANNGDAANKIGTYALAVLAKENNIPFYIAAPLSTIDFTCKTGENIPIEERSEQEVLEVTGLASSGNIEKVKISPEKASAKNVAFDVTPAKYIAGIITEKGIFKPEDIKNLA